MQNKNKMILPSLTRKTPHRRQRLEGIFCNLRLSKTP